MKQKIYAILGGIMLLLTMNACLSDDIKMGDSADEVVLTLNLEQAVGITDKSELSNIRYYFFKQEGQNDSVRYVFSESRDFASVDEIGSISLDRGIYRVIVFANFLPDDFEEIGLVAGETSDKDFRIRLKEGKKVPELLYGATYFSMYGTPGDLVVNLSIGRVSKMQLYVKTHPKEVEQFQLQLNLPGVALDSYGQLHLEEGGSTEIVDLYYSEIDSCFKSEPIVCFALDTLDVVFNLELHNQTYKIDHKLKMGPSGWFSRINLEVSVMEHLVIQGVKIIPWNHAGNINLEAPVFTFRYKKHPDCQYFLREIFLKDKISNKIICLEQVGSYETDLGNNVKEVTFTYPWDGDFFIMGVRGYGTIDFYEPIPITLPKDRNYTLADTMTLHSLYGIGEGTEEKPFLVYSGLTLPKESEGAYYFKQIRDIRLSSRLFDTEIIDEDWEGMGGFKQADLSENCVFDGNGYLIEGDIPGDSRFTTFLFRYCEGMIKNLNLVVEGKDEGLIGNIYKYGKVLNCNIKGKGNTSVVFTDYLADGAVIENSCSRSESGTAIFIGGDNAGTIRNCYVMGNFRAEEMGAFGRLYASGQILNSYAILNGSIEHLQSGYSLVQQEDEALNMLHCYYDSNLSPYKAVYYPLNESYMDVADKAEGRTTAEMKTKTTYVGWKFGNDDANPWQIDPQVNEGYPYLYWEKR